MKLQTTIPHKPLPFHSRIIMTKTMAILNNLLSVVIVGIISSSSTIRLVSSQCPTEAEAYGSCLSSDCVISCTADDFKQLSSASASAGTSDSKEGYCSFQKITSCLLEKCCSECSSVTDDFFTCLLLEIYPNETKCSIDCGTDNTGSGADGGGGGNDESTMTPSMTPPSSATPAPAQANATTPTGGAEANATTPTGGAGAATPTASGGNSTEKSDTGRLSDSVSSFLLTTAVAGIIIIVATIN